MDRSVLCFILLRLLRAIVIWHKDVLPVVTNCKRAFILFAIYMVRVQDLMLFLLQFHRFIFIFAVDKGIFILKI